MPLNAETSGLHQRTAFDADGNDLPPAKRRLKAIEPRGNSVARLMTVQGQDVFRLPETGTPVLAAVRRVNIGEPGRSYRFTRQTARDPLAADFVPAGETKPSTPFSFETVEDRYRTVAVLSDPVDLIDLQDVAGLDEQIADELARRVFRRIEWALLNGEQSEADEEREGSFDGILQTEGVQHTFFQNSAVHTIRHAIGAVEGQGFEPTAAILNPADMLAIELSEDSAGNPLFASRLQDRGESKLFGLDVHTSTLIPAGTAVIGDWNQALLTVRNDVQLAWTDAGAENFNRNRVTFRAEARVGFNALYPQAFTVANLAE